MKVYKQYKASVRGLAAGNLADSDFTSTQERLRQFGEPPQPEASTPVDPAIQQPADLLPFVGGGHSDTPKGIAFTLPDYLQLVDWTGRAVRDDKRGAIPPHIQPILHGGRPLRTLYAFDPRRFAILLLGGDKAGDRRWYEVHVPIADRLYDEHLEQRRREGLLDG